MVVVVGEVVGTNGIEVGVVGDGGDVVDEVVEELDEVLAVLVVVTAGVHVNVSDPLLSFPPVMNVGDACPTVLVAST